METMTGGALLARTLNRAGVSEVFSLHGGHLDAFLIACADHGIRLTDTRHEASAGHAAAAYARATGRVGVAVVTAGPGFTNAYTAIADAYLDRMPVLFVVGAPSTREGHLNTLQGGIDQVAAASHVTKWAFRVGNGARLPEIVEQAIRRAKIGTPGPVLLEVPIEVMFTPVAVPPNGGPSAHAEVPNGPAPCRAQTDALLALLSSAERPVIVAGGGATLSRSGEALLAFAQASGVPVVTGPKADGLMPQEHPLHGGGMASVALAAATGAPADAVLLLGQRIGLFTGGRHGLIPRDARVAQVDIDGGEPGRGGAIDLAVMADCRETLLALTAAAAGRTWAVRDDWPAALRAARELPSRRWADVPAIGETGLMHPFHACKALAEALPEDAVIVCDGGESSVWIRDHVWPRGTGAFHITGYLGTLGVGQGFAIGAARAFPDRPVYLFAGDGGVGFHLQEFDTMVRHGLDVHTVVLNNACWGMSQNGQDLIYGRDRRAIVTLADSAYQTVAEAFGGRGWRAETPGEIAAAMREARGAGVPTCINVRIDGAVINPVTMSMVGIKPGERPPAPARSAAEERAGRTARVVMPYYENVE